MKKAQDKTVEVIPAILHRDFDSIRRDWEATIDAVNHIQIDITDGVFAGDGTFRQIARFKELGQADKIELHMMVQPPADYMDDIKDLQPGRCVFHVEAFSSEDELRFCYQELKQHVRLIGLAINPATALERLIAVKDAIDYVLFMGYQPGRANTPLDEQVFDKIRLFRQADESMLITVDGCVTKQTVGDYVAAGARVLNANTAIFGAGDPVENIRQLELIGQAALAESPE